MPAVPRWALHAAEMPTSSRRVAPSCAGFHADRTVPTKLRPDQVRQLRELFDGRARALANLEPMPFTLAELGQLFGVSRSTAYRVGTRLSHRDVNDERDQVGEGRTPSHPTRAAMRSRAYRARRAAADRGLSAATRRQVGQPCAT